MTRERDGNGRTAPVGPHRRRVRAAAVLPLALGALALALFWASAAAAQQLTVDLGGGSLTLRTIQLIVLIGVISLAPGIAIMVTCFPFMVTVLSILRQALGLQQAPPNMLIVSLALFLTYFVMQPVFQQAWQDGIRPLSEDRIDLSRAAPRIIAPFRGFMLKRVDPETLRRLQLARAEGLDRPGAEADATAAGETDGQIDLAVLIPAFMLSEVARAFRIGFVLFLPFLVIDLVVAAVLMSMGMMMVPPAIVALPFKLAFFVMADGWSLLSEALVRGYQ